MHTETILVFVGCSDPAGGIGRECLLGSERETGPST
jgi:hypothetical protein